MCLDFTTGHLVIAGLASDIAGAVILALSFMTKSPSKIVKETAPMGLAGGMANAAYLPKPFVRSMVRQRAEAAVGLFFLVTGFVLQGIAYVIEADAVSTGDQRLTAGLVTVGVWLLGFAAFRWITPRIEQRDLRDKALRRAAEPD